MARRIGLVGNLWSDLYKKGATVLEATEDPEDEKSGSKVVWVKVA